MGSRPRSGAELDLYVCQKVDRHPNDHSAHASHDVHVYWLATASLVRMIVVQDQMPGIIRSSPIQLDRVTPLVTPKQS